MAKVEDALRELIQYRAKRAARELLGKLPGQLRQARRELRELRRLVDGLQKDVRSLLEAQKKAMAVPPVPEAEMAKARFTKRTLKSIRKKLGMTQEELAKLLDVSPVSITSWETGKSKPRRENVARILALRRMSRPQADEALGRKQPEKPEQPAKPMAAGPTAAEIRGIRKGLGLSQGQMAKKLGVSPGSIYNWESGGARPSGASIRKLLGLGKKRKTKRQ